MSVEREVCIALADGGSVTGVETPIPNAAWTFVYAPGAGSNLHDPFGRFACRALAGSGMASLRFQFPYQEAGKRSPDRTATLEATWIAVIAYARVLGGALVVGGRSMGGRIASQVVAKGERVDRLALFAYPLHPPGKPDQMRDEHMPALPVPVLFVSGTRDSFAAPDELTHAAAKVPDAMVRFLEGADHGFSVPKSSGRTRDDVWSEAVAALAGWLGL